MTKKPKLTVKEQKLVKGIVEGKSQAQAARDAGYSPHSAKEIASETLTKPNVKDALHMELQKQGITLEAIVKPVKDALNAEKVHIVGNGDQAMAEVVVDHTTRLAAVKIASKWAGLEQSQEGGTNNTFIQVNNNYKDKYAD